jgi:CubicO group peptidase (beta-lactamase class C family)
MKQIVVWFAFMVASPVVFAQSPWASQTGLTEAQMGNWVTHWSPAPYELSPVCVSGYEEAGQIRYAALWARREDDDARLVLIGQTTADLTSANAIRQAQGYRLIWLNGFQSGGVDYYNAIYRRTSGPAQVLRLGDSLSEHQAADASLSGYYLDNLCAFRAGLSPRYGAWWNRGTFAPVTDISYGLTEAEYQTEFNQRAGSWRLHNVCGYHTAINDANRYTVVWRRPTRTGDWSAMHGLEKLNYFAAQGNQTMVGRRPVFQQAWASGAEIRFNAIWVENGGLDGYWVDQLDRDVTEHMRTNGIPGVTLAVSRHGRLVLAKGYGLADQEAGEWAGPDHRFRVASVSKPVCAVSVLHTLENFPGRSLNSRLFGAVGIFGADYGTPPYSTREQGIALRNVLNHTAGWYHDGKLWWHNEPAWGSEHKPVIDYQLDSVPQNAPGESGRYSNLGFVIAARVVEKMTGRTFEDYTVNEVLASCGVSGATRMAVGERTRAQQQFMEAAYYPSASFDDDPYLIDPRRMDGSTAWIARPTDLLLLARRIDGNATHTDILSADSIADMKTPGSPSVSEGYDHQRYGLGWGTDNINNPSYWGHNGGMAGTVADFIVRVDGTSFAWMANAPTNSLTSTINAWAARITAADAWPDIDLFYSAHPLYDAWAVSNFSSLDRGQPGLRTSYHGPDGDPDGDQIPNAGEAYLGLDPLSPNPSPLSTAKVGSNLRVRWQRSVTERGVRISLQTSSDLVNWFTPIGVPITDRPDLFSLVGKMYQEVLIPITGNRRFARIVYRTH